MITPRVRTAYKVLVGSEGVNNDYSSLENAPATDYEPIRSYSFTGFKKSMLQTVLGALATLALCPPTLG